MWQQISSLVRLSLSFSIFVKKIIELHLPAHICLMRITSPKHLVTITQLDDYYQTFLLMYRMISATNSEFASVVKCSRSRENEGNPGAFLAHLSHPSILIPYTRERAVSSHFPSVPSLLFRTVCRLSAAR